MHWRIYCLWTLLATILFMWIPRAAKCCSCVGTSTVASSLKTDDFVAVGVVKSKVRIAAATVLRGVEAENHFPFLSTDTIFFAYRVKYTVEIEEVYKGNKHKKMVEVFTAQGRGDCGYQFQLGSRYIIYAHSRHTMLIVHDGAKEREINVPAFLATNICTRTTEVNEAEIKQLREATKSSRKRTS